MLELGDTVTVGCTLCHLMLAERVPFVQRRSIYRLVLEDEGFVWPDHAGREVTLQDCWRARHVAWLRDDIGACLSRINVRWHEMPERREQTRFCGTWLNNEPAPDYAELVPQAFSQIEGVRELLPLEDQGARVRAWRANYPTDEVAVYCNGCEREVALGGKHPDSRNVLATRRTREGPSRSQHAPRAQHANMGDGAVLACLDGRSPRQPLGRHIAWPLRVASR